MAHASLVILHVMRVKMTLENVRYAFTHRIWLQKAVFAYVMMGTLMIHHNALHDLTHAKIAHWTLFFVKCSVCTDPSMKIVYGICVCQDRYYVNNAFMCTACSKNCAVCINNPTNDGSTCSTCDDELNMEKQPDGSCVCRTGYYVFKAVCTVCDKTCKTCKN